MFSFAPSERKKKRREYTSALLLVHNSSVHSTITSPAVSLSSSELQLVNDTHRVQAIRDATELFRNVGAARVNLASFVLVAPSTVIQEFFEGKTAHWLPCDDLSR